MRFKSSLIVSDTEGTIRLTKAGLELEISKLGTPSSFYATLNSDLGVNLPLKLSSSSSKITDGVTLSGPKVTGNLTLKPKTSVSLAYDGQVTGNLTFTTSKGAVQFDFDWGVEDAP